MDIEKIRHLLSLNYSLEEIFKLDNDQLMEYKEAIALQYQLNVITHEELSLDTNLINERLGQLRGVQQQIPTLDDYRRASNKSPDNFDSTQNERANSLFSDMVKDIIKMDQYEKDDERTKHTQTTSSNDGPAERKDLAFALVELLTEYGVLSPVEEPDDDYSDEYDYKCDSSYGCDDTDYVSVLQDTIYSLIESVKTYKNSCADDADSYSLAEYHEKYSNVAVSLPRGMDIWSTLASVADNNDIIIAVDNIPDGVHTDAATITTDIVSKIPAIPSNINVGNVFVIFTPGFNKSSFAEIYNKFSNNVDQVFVLVS